MRYSKTAVEHNVKQTMKMSHEEYIQKQRNRAMAVARGMLDGSMHYLEGAVELSSLGFEIGFTENDPDFFAFTAVASEIDHLPLGAARQYWSQEALNKHELEIERSINWAKDFSLSNCKSIIEKFSA